MPVRFADCTLDTDSRELLRAGRPVHLTGKAFRLLELLVENGPKALSKDALQDGIWPDVFVTESNVASLVAELRKALGDDARQPSLIRTVYGFGYAFCGEVAEADASTSVSQRSRVSRYQLLWRDTLIALAEGENILGRGPESVRSIDSATVSRRHARIVVASGEATVEDLGSKNGTYLCGRRVEHAMPLADGDEIRLGSASLRLKLLAEPPLTASKSERT